MPGVVKFEMDIEKDATIALMTLKGELIALGNARMSASDLKAKSKGVAARVIAVFMKPGTYPRLQKST